MGLSAQPVTVVCRVESIARRRVAPLRLRAESAPWQQIPASLVVNLPLFRRTLATRIDYWLPCGCENWQDLYRALRLPGEPRAHWAFFSSQSRPGRFGAFPIDRGGRVEHFVEARRDPFGYWPEPSDQTPFRVPAAIAGAHLGEWRLRVLEALPRLHRAPRLDARQLRAVCSGIQVIGNDVVRPDGVPDSWVPIHLEPATGPRQQALAS